jgi:hypothetical protein
MQRERFFFILHSYLNSPLAANEGALAERLELPRDNQSAGVPSFFSHSKPEFKAGSR